MDWKSIFATRSSRMRASEIRELLKLLDQPDVISFAGGIPDPKLFPAKAFQEAFSDILAGDQRHNALQYSVSEGYMPLRQWISGQMDKLGVPCDVDNVLITSGSQQALDYLGKLFISPGDTALVSWPTYMGALGAFNAYEPSFDRLIPNGNRSAADYKSNAEAQGNQVKFAYMSVDFANPTGETMALSARERLLEMADELDIAVIEDAAYQSLRYDGETLPPILALDVARNGHIDKTRTLYCGSFSKTLSPGLRVGWVCAAKSVIDKLVLMKQASDLHSPSINQMAVYEVASNGFDRQVKNIRNTYSARRDQMLQSLERHMPSGVQWTRPEGGMFIWLTLPSHIDGADLLAEALKTHRIAFVPGRAFYADGSNGNTLRLSFTQAGESTIEEGIRRLGELLKSQENQ
ncbi:MAG: PLP-dependent aminotransferase family protein [Hyphomicrobiales bacterium]